MGGFRINGCGWYENAKHLISIGQYTCPNCNNHTTFWVSEMNKRISAFFIPVAQIGKKYALLCDRCETGYYISEAQASVAQHGNIRELQLLIQPSNAQTVETVPQNTSSSATKICPRCSEHARAGQSFCERCGTQL